MTNEELVQLYQGGNKYSLEELVEQNTGIVYKLANKFYINQTNSIDIEDLQQEGFMGLMIAAEKYKFDMENNAKFITYAAYWIYQKMNRFIKYRNTNAETSLNAPVGEGGETELVDFVEGVDYEYENVEEQLYIKQLRLELEGAMHECNTLKEREVLMFRYGWDTESMSLQYIGDMFGIRAERVRQIEVRALRRLRNSTWCRQNAKQFCELGYISDFYREVLKNRGIAV